MTAVDDPTAASVPVAAEAAVVTTALTKRFDRVTAVEGLHLTIPRGSVFGLIGPNGAGKTTTLAMIATLLTPTSGSLLVLGHEPAAAPFEVRRQLGFMPDVLGVYDRLRVDEYLRFFAASYRLPRATWPGLIDGLLELVDLTTKRAAMVNSLSRGMKQRLSLARTLVHDPELLVLDEPASGLDPRARVELRDLLRQLQAMGKTIIISSHILADLQEVCTDIAIMEAGRLLAAGPPRQILDELGRGRAVRVRFADGTEEAHQVADADAQAALLRRLVVDEGRPVVEFLEDHGGLEHLFLSITEGVVQ